jgi:hypothetical protein
MSHTSRTGLMISLGAAAAAFGVAAMMSTATAPTARADDLSDIIGQVEGDFGDGQTAFGAAESAFASSPETGLADLFDGINDDFLSAPQDLLVGTAEAANGLTLEFPGGGWDFGILTSFSEGLENAESDLSGVSALFTEGADYLASGDYGYAAYEDVLGVELGSIVPLEEILLGSVASF